MKIYSWMLIVVLGLTLLNGCATTNNNSSETQTFTPDPASSISGSVAEKVNRI